MAREKFSFWLNLDKDEEFLLADQIFELKQERSFVATIRDGLRLIGDLRAGRLDMLLALFPWVEEAFYQRFVGQKTGSDYALREQLAKLERLLIEQGNTPVSTHNVPKPLAIPIIVDPIPDDADDVELTIRKAASDGRSTRNFLNSAFDLVR